MDFSIQSLNDFANKNKIPLILKQHNVTTKKNGEVIPPCVEIWCLKKDEQKIKEWLYYSKPIWVEDKVHSVENIKKLTGMS